MNPDTISAVSSSSASSSRSESISLYAFIATIIVAPVAFLPTPYFALDLVKTIVITVGTLVAAIFCATTVMKDRKLVLPPASLFWTGALLVVSTLISSLTSIQVMKSLLGQGFEVGTAGFMFAAFLAGLVAFSLVSRSHNRAIVIYAAAIGSYILLYAFQFLRLVFGAGFLGMGILNSKTSTLLGSWNSLGIYSAVVLIVSVSAILFLPVSKKLNIFYIVLAVLSAIGVFIVATPITWFILAIVFLGFTIFMTLSRPSQGGSFFSSLWKRLAWLPLVLFVVSAVLTSRQAAWSTPLLTKMNANSVELALPWQMTLDVVAGSIKNYPLFGIGPNHFSQAFLTYKPDGINQGDGWGIEFGTGFGLIPTLVAAQGLVGTVLWILFYVFLGVLGTRALRKLPSDPSERFVVISSFAVSAFLWLAALVAVPSHAVLFLTFVMTGMFLGTSVAYGILKPFTFAPNAGTSMYKMMPSLLTLFIIVAAVWGIMYAKKTLALTYFGSGIKQLTVAGNADMADTYFKKALAIDSSDVYWQARAEAALAKATKLASTVTAQTPASTSQAVLANISETLNGALQYSMNAISYDPTNYYNYVSEARVSEAAANFRLDKAYDNAVAAYARAIALNPHNPSLYLSLARLQASQNKLDDALKTIGATLQVKNNYLDAIFLLSQVDAAKGNLPEAVTAAQYAIQINPNNPLLYFQLGLLQYNAKSYQAAAEALSQAVKMQPDYANARYFLGLAQSRLGNSTEATAQFTELNRTNPDNQEVKLILANLQAGKPIFADAQPPVTTSPEKRSTLPIQQKAQ